MHSISSRMHEGSEMTQDPTVPRLAGDEQEEEQHMSREEDSKQHMSREEDSKQHMSREEDKMGR